MKFCINSQGHMTKMAAMAINSKKFQKSSSNLEHLHSQRFGHRLNASACACLAPGRYSILKSYFDKSSIQMGSFKLNNQNNDWWSLLTRVFVPESIAGNALQSVEWLTIPCR